MRTKAQINEALRIHLRQLQTAFECCGKSRTTTRLADCHAEVRRCLRAMSALVEERPSDLTTSKSKPELESYWPDNVADSDEQKAATE